MRRLGAIVRNAERMMIQALATSDGIEFTFADGCRGTVPYSDALGGRKGSLVSIDLSSPFKADLNVSVGEPIELPWDFVRHYCDASYEQKVNAISALGRQSLGARIRAFRKAADMTQSMLAEAAGIGRVTETRIEKGEQSPRYETLVNIARSLDRPVSDLVAEDTPPPNKPSLRRLPTGIDTKATTTPVITSYAAMPGRLAPAATVVRETQKSFVISSDVRGQHSTGPTQVRVPGRGRTRSRRNVA